MPLKCYANGVKNDGDDVIVKSRHHHFHHSAMLILCRNYLNSLFCYFADFSAVVDRNGDTEPFYVHMNFYMVGLFSLRSFFHSFMCSLEK